MHMVKGRHPTTWPWNIHSAKMSYCKRDGKDVSIFVTKDDVDNPEAVTSLAQDELYGIVLPSGELNWDCPCLGGMAYGPCGQEFKDAFSCFHYSEAEEKGSDCIPQFRTMQECFEKHPEEYGKYADNDDDGSDETQEREEEAGSRDKEAEQKGEEERTEKLGGGGGEGKGTAAKDQQQTKGENSKVEGERTTPAQASPEASTTK